MRRRFEESNSCRYTRALWILMNSRGDSPDYAISENEHFELISDINKCADNTLNIINELLNTQTIESGVVKLSIQPADLAIAGVDRAELFAAQSKN